METRMGSARRRDTQQFKSYYVVWKHIFNISYLHYNNKFKSYYVVWKLSFCPDAAFLMARLNRTMQYGNGASVGAVPAQEKKFKSYYVVWKLGHGIKYTSLTLRFKSYYVVWKPCERRPSIEYPPCLNRTMQYGNIKNPKIIGGTISV